MPDTYPYVLWSSETYPQFHDGILPPLRIVRSSKDVFIFEKKISNAMGEIHWVAEQDGNVMFNAAMQYIATTADSFAELLCEGAS